MGKELVFVFLFNFLFLFIHVSYIIRERIVIPLHSEWFYLFFGNFLAEKIKNGPPEEAHAHTTMFYLIIYRSGIDIFLTIEQL
ncbi:hypothetical protein J2Y03_002300 [Neobacillus niacini]|uniref:hypothetical protein n=1 Tax=Neobacillus niacini TaxID=86668 RepID=UPI00285968A2|nr:hypothetical protein [Neobacillus niacini]MDR7077276.1 hypothetical protein [Neobacillus niacini]